MNTDTNLFANNPAGGGNRQPFRVKPIDSVPRDNLINNIRENLKLISSWIDRSRIHPETAWLLSAGPSLKKSLELGLLTPKMMESDDTKKVFCVKHTLPILKEHGIVPFACVILDPRPIEGISTLGYKRLDLFKALPKESIIFVASMTNPSTTRYLLDKGHKVIGWHAAVQGMEEFKKEIKWAVTQGTCSAVRTIGLAHVLGFRVFRLAGFDSSFEPGFTITDKQKKEVDPNTRAPKYIETFIQNMGPFWTTGELIAQVQDVEQMLKAEDTDIDIAFVGLDKGTSLMGAMVDACINGMQKCLPEYKKVLKIEQ